MVEWLEDDIRVIVAENASGYTGPGTNTYVLGRGRVALIDPGPRSPAHLAALRAALAGEVMAAVVVTHAHLDHSESAREVAQAFAAPLVGFGAAHDGRSSRMAALSGTLGAGGEGVDAAFRPDIRLRDGESLAEGDWRLTALHTPGHLGNHICLETAGRVFSGDHVMGWSTTLVWPPDGDMTDYLASLDRLRSLDARVLYSGHGAPVTDPAARIDALIAHRHGRAAQILQALRAGPATAAELRARIYADLAPGLWLAAERTTLAQLIDLAAGNRIAALGPLTPDTRFHLI